MRFLPDPELAWERMGKTMFDLPEQSGTIRSPSFFRQQNVCSVPPSQSLGPDQESLNRRWAQLRRHCDGRSVRGAR